MKKNKSNARSVGRHLTAVDLFSGCGGLTLGLKLSGFKVLAAVEKDGLAVRTYSANHPEVLVRHGDIEAVTATGLMRELGLKSGELDLLAGCPPCQGFSVLRTRNGSVRNGDRRNRLIGEMLRFARAFRPKAVMIENVPGLSNHWSFLRLCRGLRGLGYRVEWDIKDAQHFGVPQRRKRLILLAARGVKVEFASASDQKRTVRQAIGRLAKAGTSRDDLHNLPEHRSRDVKELIKAIPKDGGSRSDLPRSRQLPCHRRVDGFNDIYGRMAWDEPSPTITSGCFNPSKGRFLHPRENRAITLREAALLQSFPLRYWFPIDASKEATAAMIGNALPPAFIQSQASAIARALKKARRGRTA